MSGDGGPLLAVEDLTVEFHLSSGRLRAVDGVSFTLEPGQTTALVGESGSGKTATALAIMRLHAVPPCVYAGGRILYRGQDLLRLSERSMYQVRGGEIAMVFQDPMTGLNPLSTVGAQIAEAVRMHQHASRRDAYRAAVAALGEVGVANPERRARQYPHEFSGGMRQRVMIAMALACRPSVLLADEPTTALDVTIQAQIVDLLKELQDRHGTAILLITHDLGLVAQLAQNVLVMYGGRPVERASVDDLFSQPLMPYTWALLRSMPQAGAYDDRELRPIAGQPPNLLDPPPGCGFAPRCPFAMPRCERSVPPLVERLPGHHSACLLDREEFEDHRKRAETEAEAAR